MKVVIGMPVRVFGAESNSHSDQPGLVSCIHGKIDEEKGRVLINAVAFPDCAVYAGRAQVQDRTSIYLYRDEAARDADPGKSQNYALLV